MFSKPPWLEWLCRIFMFIAFKECLTDVTTYGLRESCGLPTLRGHPCHRDMLSLEICWLHLNLFFHTLVCGKKVTPYWRVHILVCPWDFILGRGQTSVCNDGKRWTEGTRVRTFGAKGISPPPSHRCRREGRHGGPGFSGSGGAVVITPEERQRRQWGTRKIS